MYLNVYHHWMCACRQAEANGQTHMHDLTSAQGCLEQEACEVRAPAMKPAAAVLTTKALRRHLDSCLYRCSSSGSVARPLVLATPAALEGDRAAAAAAAPAGLTAASAAAAK